MEDNHYEVIEVKGVSVYEDKKIWIYPAKDGEGWNTFVCYQPDDDDNTRTIDPSVIKKSWAKKFRAEMQEDMQEDMPFHVGYSLSASEIKSLVTYFRRKALVGILRRKRECDTDLNIEKWSNYWSEEGY